MELFEAIFTRRSIRKYTNQILEKENIEKLLKAAMAAPSAGNKQPWHFIVITERRILEKIPEFHPYSRMLKEAQAAILVCGDNKLEYYGGYWILDCSAATQNILLAAHALGIGAVWLGIHPRMDRVIKIKELLGIPEHVHPLSLISLGYPNEHPAQANRYDSSRIHRNKW